MIPTENNSTPKMDTDSVCTDNGTITHEYIYPQKLTSMVISIICSVFMVYIIISLTYFTWKKKACGSGGSDRNSATSGGSTVVLALSYVLSFSIMLHFVSLLPLLGKPEEPFCAFYHRFSTVLAGISFTSAFFALWFRVYVVFYHHPLIKSSLKLVRYLSKAAVVFLAVMIGVNLVNFLTAPPYKTCSLGCLRVRDEEGGQELKWGMLVASAVLFQATLLFLLVFPLLMHRKKMINSGFQSTVVMPIIKRAFITAIVCIISNVIIGLYGIISSEKFTYIRHIVYGINFVVSLVALICFSADWKERLCPCYLRCKKSGARNDNTIRRSHYHCSGNVNSISQGIKN